MLLAAWRLPHLRVGPFGDNQVPRDYSLLLVAVFAASVDDALTLSRGVIADYKTVNEALPYVRGRIDYARQLKRPLGFSDPRVACSFAELTEDTPQNRLLSTATTRMLHMATALLQSPEGRAWQPLGDALVKLERASRMLSSVPSRWFSERELSNFATCPTPRYRFYEPALSLAKAILLSSSLEGSGSDAGISFLINMNDAFEEYVRATLRKVSADSRMTWSEVTIRPLPDSGSAFALNNKGYAPDCVCKCNDRCVVADAKYKRLHLSKSGRLLPIREDVFQMLAYMSMLGASAGLLVYAACDPRYYATAAPPQSGQSTFLWRAEWDSGAKLYFLCLNLKCRGWVLKIFFDAISETLAVAARPILTLAALLAATNMRSPGSAWAGLLMAALRAVVVVLGVGSGALHARACDSAHFCAQKQDAFLLQGHGIGSGRGGGRRNAGWGGRLPSLAA
ncbi:hypothetical protein EMIHUDRAFT_236954 [Emiliania huxleyi CCMP1516]|uniref:PD-(D/E)XK endonuclease-like domain-containing protein n=2 Tax=Emiliania huxleyi TaxID=2903 RepID=A0A0D3JRM6_EMIH1|nr:hypothetical protein EMIHUDRAFT_236954 [Emiliania huxleyi CCMP1516]EOD26161.1 hypothetical protein EMIHUDRAFT_236954 [Emiliania huxleyi CCMP1516]|eukprot:XP_005778590.1 hypothetical protein EMIHUDRAFT_236954 [Emiliania huxleyi CCMP1516]